MSIDTCAEKLGLLLTKGQTKRAKLEADRLTNLYSDDPRYAGQDVRSKAEIDAVQGEIHKAEYEAYKVAVTAERIDTLGKFIDNSTDARISLLSKKRPKQEALQSILVGDSTGKAGVKQGGVISIHTKGGVIFGQHTTKLFDTVERFRSKVPGGVDTYFASRKLDANNLTRALMGETIQDPKIVSMSTELKRTTDELFDRFKSSGADIHKLENWGLPMNHNRSSVVNVARAQYIDDTFKELKPGSMRAPDGTPLSNDDMKSIIGHEYDEIKADRSIPFKAGSGIAKRYQKQRIYHWKDADSYLRFADKYGQGDVYNNMIRYINRLSNDIAVLETLGPNPDAVFKALKERALSGGEPGYFAHSIDSVYDIVRGKSNGFNNLRLAEAISTAQSVEVGTKLGSAALSAIGDTGFVRSELRLLGGSSLRYFRNLGLNLASKDLRRLASEIGMPLDYALNNNIAALRYSEQSGIGKISRFAGSTADAVVRGTGLNHWTVSEQVAFYTEAMQTITKKLNKEFEQLDAGFKELLTQYGITKQDWSGYKSSIREFKSPFGLTKLLDVTAIKDNEALAKIHSLVNDSLEYAVPMPNPLTRSITSRGSNVGATIAKKLLLFFQSFTAASWIGSINRAMQNPAFGGTASRTLATAKLGLELTIIGAVTQQLFDITKGRDPADWSDPTLWAKGFIRSGGGGFYANAVQNIEYSGGDKSRIVSGFAGPLVGDAGGILSLIATGALLGLKVLKSDASISSKNEIKKDTIDLENQLIDTVFALTPGSNIWYARRAIVENLKYGLKESLNPKETEDHWKRMNKKYDSWWPQGNLLPVRMPQTPTQKDEKKT